MLDEEKMRPNYWIGSCFEFLQCLDTVVCERMGQEDGGELAR